MVRACLAFIGWCLVAPLLPAQGPCDFVERSADQGSPMAGFGSSLSLRDGSAVVGAPAEDLSRERQGAVYVYESTRSNWVLAQTLTAPDSVLDDDRFGHSIAHHGEWLAIGRTGDRPSVEDPWRGAVHLYRHDGVRWVHHTKIASSDNDAFGWRVALDGSTLVATSQHSHYARIYEHDGVSWNLQANLSGPPGSGFGGSVAIDAGRIAVGAHLEDGAGNARGAIYVFRRNGGTWQQEARLTGSAGQDLAYFGSQLAFADGCLLAGAFGESEGGLLQSGAAYLFRHDGAGWMEEARLLPPSPVSRGWFGVGVAVQADEAWVGAPEDYSRGPRDGSVYRFVREDGTWMLRQVLRDDRQETGFGWRLALDGPTAVVGLARGDALWRGGVDLLVIPSLGLEVDPLTPRQGDDLEFRVCGGLVAGPCLLSVNEINGAPAFASLFLGSFDDRGRFSRSAVVPPGLAGWTAGFRAYGFARWSGQLQSQLARVTFQ